MKKFTKIWNRKSRLMLIEQMEMYISAGLPILDVIDTLGTRMEKKDKRRQESLRRIKASLESGKKLSVVFYEEVRPPPTVIGLIACGETSGSLGIALKSAHATLEREDELIKKCLSAMTYPVVIGLATIGLTVGLMCGVMPQIVPLLSGLHTKLPFITWVMMFLSQFLVSYGLYVLVGLVVVIILAPVIYQRIRILRKITESILVRLPILGTLINQYALSIFFQSFGSLVESGLHANIAYTRTLNSIGFDVIRKRFESRGEVIRSGEQFSSILEKGIPTYIVPLLRAGEASGNFGASLLRASNILDRELDHSLKRLTSLIEPIMMIGMGGIVGLIALSIMMPIYDISKTLQH